VTETVSDFSIRLLSVYRRPLEDTADVIVSSPQSGTVVRQKKDHAATKTLRMTNFDPGVPYLVGAFPMRHRPVQQFVMAPQDGTKTIELSCPVDPRRVVDVTFPAYGNLPNKAKAILQASQLEHPPRNVSGQLLYDSAELDRIPKAGFLNLIAKMGRTPLGNGSTVLDHVDSLYRIRGDRVFANVSLALRDLVKNSVPAHLFHEADDSQHAPPPTFERKGSYKTSDLYGNLQVTFFSNPQTLELKADIDIDDAAGIGHVFQVIGHVISGKDTNPYDIHEILLYHQFLDPGYQLVT
jgi:hypothetical protein